MVLEDLQDPGNAGTIIRTGEGAGVSGVFLTKNLCGYYKSKGNSCNDGICLQNSFFLCGRCGIIKTETSGTEESAFLPHIYRVKTHMTGNPIEDGTAFLIGNEGKGLTDQAADAADCLIRIPMCGQVESLNAAMAAGILMYEAARQRRG